jgi:hypothetical protein
MIIDRPSVLRNLVEKHKPYASDRDAELLFTRCGSALDKYSKELSEIMDKEWKAGRWMNFFPSPDRPEIIGLDKDKK